MLLIYANNRERSLSENTVKLFNIKDQKTKENVSVAMLEDYALSSMKIQPSKDIFDNLIADPSYYIEGVTVSDDMQYSKDINSNTKRLLRLTVWSDSATAGIGYAVIYGADINGNILPLEVLKVDYSTNITTLPEGFLLGVYTINIAGSLFIRVGLKTTDVGSLSAKIGVA